MKLSQRMLEDLKWCVGVEDSNKGQKTKIGMRRPTHHQNIVTHEALLRRGMLEEDAEGNIRVTEAGRKAAKGE